MKNLKALFALLRPSHWIKNVFVFLPLFFNGSFGNVSSLRNTVLVFISFCFLSSSIYCLNDIRDVEADRLHEKKRNRPIASGAISLQLAAITMVVLLLLCALPLWFLSCNRALVLCAVFMYYVLNVAYCFWLKHIAILDVLVLSFGYVLRLISGGIAGTVALTHWIILMTYLLSLFLALAKRRDDVLMMAKTGIPPRKNTVRYSLDFINHLLTLTTTIVIFCYIMYTMQGDVMERFGTRHLYITALFVLAGFMRYLQLSLVDGKTGDPVKIALHDTALICAVGLWLISFIALIYMPHFFRELA